MSAKVLMVQGTMSDVGKSVLVAGLCRVMAQDGYRVAPFKSQNMALNSAVTSDGAEIGRAQAMQAEAAGIAPTPDMNPVLLKPTTDMGSQVVVCGKPLQNMSAREYFAFKSQLKDRILESYQRLAATYDVVLIEGAGSPVELNLKRDDIVNMGIAKAVGAPVLLVGDIDRGGVFAQLVGTLELLEPDERALIKATVVNKFRGDPTLFGDGMQILRERTGIPVAGLMPFMQLDLDDEDSVSVRLGVRSHSKLIDVAVIRLPKISNFTDFAALDAIDKVGVRYVTTPHELGRPDLIIVPGSKATIADLTWMHDTGMAKAVTHAAAAGVPVLGVCGGYQMLGQSISDPHGVEGGGEAQGLGLLPTHTTFVRTKRNARRHGTFDKVEGPLAPLSGMPICGYEIHMGRTVCEGGQPLVELRSPDGSVTADGCQQGNVYGCYLHGLFDTPEANAALVRSLLQRRGLDASLVFGCDMQTHRQQQYDLLADGIREHMDMDLVYRILSEGV